MSTGYPGGTTTSDPQVVALERRVARLEGDVAHLKSQLAGRDRRTADRRMWLGYYAYSAFMAVAIAVIVYLAASLD